MKIYLLMEHIDYYWFRPPKRKLKEIGTLENDKGFYNFGLTENPYFSYKDGLGFIMLTLEGKPMSMFY